MRLSNRADGVLDWLCHESMLCFVVVVLCWLVFCVLAGDGRTTAASSMRVGRRVVLMRAALSRRPLQRW